MKRYQTISLSLVVLVFVLAACGEGASVGSEDLLEFDESEQARIGERVPDEEPTDAQGAIGRVSPTPEALPSPSPTTQKYFNIYMVAHSPFYEAEGENFPRQASYQWEVDVNIILRVTNEDATEGRPFRTFSAQNGDFSSPQLKLGEQWTLKLPQRGEWGIEDACCPFITSVKVTVR